MKTDTTFDRWRITPCPETLLFNFKNTVKSEYEAIETLTKQYGRETIMCARQLKNKTAPAGIIIEVCFATNQARAQALRNGVLYNNTLLLPTTTSNVIDPITVIFFNGMALFPTQKQIMTEVQETVKTLLADIEAKLSDKSIARVWLHRDHFGFYRGDTTVILDSYIEENLATRTATMEFLDSPDYSTICVKLEKCYLHCDACQTVNDHCTDDCDNVSAGRNKLAAHKRANTTKSEDNNSSCFDSSS
ncbi:hypothetical protein BJV82DRAFT_714223 [Fennellomyces sp. T-0311]|nr:hypothetical protein BJV82DRAFT_714223 [Fennellomyces sp. T-0311]